MSCLVLLLVSLGEAEGGREREFYSELPGTPRDDRGLAEGFSGLLRPIQVHEGLPWNSGALLEIRGSSSHPSSDLYYPSPMDPGICRV